MFKRLEVELGRRAWGVQHVGLQLGIGRRVSDSKFRVLSLGSRSQGLGSYAEGPCTQQSGTWVLGNSIYSTGFG